MPIFLACTTAVTCPRQRWVTPSESVQNNTLRLSTQTNTFKSIHIPIHTQTKLIDRQLNNPQPTSMRRTALLPPAFALLLLLVGASAVCSVEATAAAARQSRSQQQQRHRRLHAEQAAAAVRTVLDAPPRSGATSGVPFTSSLIASTGGGITPTPDCAAPAAIGGGSYLLPPKDDTKTTIVSCWGGMLGLVAWVGGWDDESGPQLAATGPPPSPPPLPTSTSLPHQQPNPTLHDPSTLRPGHRHSGDDRRRGGPLQQHRRRLRLPGLLTLRGRGGAGPPAGAAVGGVRPQGGLRLMECAWFG